ncbi:MAG TPA: GDSL-type esterase/lipase family protein [Candidatus Paceibacterota bacterium]
MERKNIVRWLLGLSAIFILLYLVFWPGVYPQITNYPPRDGSIIAFGDSLVYGTGGAAGYDFVSLLAEKAEEPIENFGIPGDTTATGLARLDTVIEKHPRIVLLLLGGNDYLRQIPREQTFKNLEAIILRLEGDGTIVVLLGVRGGLLVDHFDSDFEELAKRMGTAYVPDVLDGLFGNAQFMSDGIHPNDEGYQRIAEKISPVLLRVLH